MADSSFDIVSKIDRQEVDNALGQAAREITQRYDFKGTGAEITWSGEKTIEISANAEERAKAVLDVFKEKLVKRQHSLKILDAGDPRQSGQESKISVALKEGITTRTPRRSASSSATRARRASRCRSRATSCGCRRRSATTCRP